MDSQKKEEMVLEEMGAFFTARVDSYDEVHTKSISGGMEGKNKVAEYIPETCKSIVDLGCGTGLELEAIFEKLPEVAITAIDLSEAMLRKMEERYNNKNISIVVDNYFDYDFGTEKFDTAVSVMSLHHFTHEEKVNLYSKVCKGLKQGGVFINCDYMVPTQELEDLFYSENQRIRKELGITEGFYHYDTPCTVENEINILKKSGFSSVENVWQVENTTILVAIK